MLEIRLPLLLIQAASFLVAMALIWVLFLKPLLLAMNRRTETVRSDLAGAQQARAEAERLQKEMEAEWRTARDKIRAELEKATGQGEEQRKKIREKAMAEAEELLAKARREIGEEKEQAIKELRGETAALAVAVAEKLLSAELDASKHKKLIEEMIGKV